MRIFLIIFSFINALLYFILYAFLDSILNLIGGVSVTADIISLLKLLILIIFGFLIGLVASLFLRKNQEKSFFDYKSALTIGLIPFIFLILSLGKIPNFISVNILNSNKQLSELLFYFLSRQIIFSIWLGFGLGISASIAFNIKIRLKHEAKQEYNLE